MILVQCVNRNCTNVFYIEKYKIGLCLQCDKCINKRK
jgi:hypothetical protein